MVSLTLTLEDSVGKQFEFLLQRVARFAEKRFLLLKRLTGFFEPRFQAGLSGLIVGQLARFLFSRRCEAEPAFRVYSKYKVRR